MRRNVIVVLTVDDVAVQEVNVTSLSDRLNRLERALLFTIATSNQQAVIMNADRALRGDDAHALMEDAKRAALAEMEEQ